MINNSSGMYRFTVGSFGSRARHHLGQIQCYCLPICNRILVIFVVEAGSTVVATHNEIIFRSIRIVKYNKKESDHCSAASSKVTET